MIYDVLYIPGGAGSLPSTVVPFGHEKIHLSKVRGPEFSRDTSPFMLENFMEVGKPNSFTNDVYVVINMGSLHACVFVDAVYVTEAVIHCRSKTQSL